MPLPVLSDDPTEAELLTGAMALIDALQTRLPPETTDPATRRKIAALWKQATDLFNEIYG